MAANGCAENARTLIGFLRERGHLRAALATQNLWGRSALDMAMLEKQDLMVEILEQASHSEKPPEGQHRDASFIGA